jgi:alanine racemase
MTLRLTVDEAGFEAHVRGVRAAVPALVPVVKGNGYGYGRSALAHRALAFATQIAVGTVHELAGLDTGVDVLVLTPSMSLDGVALGANAVPTIGRPEHLEALVEHGWTGRVAVKLVSSMRRYGITSNELGALVAMVHRAGLEMHSYVLHLPLDHPLDHPTGRLPTGRPVSEATAEIEAWLPVLDASVPLSLSHLSPTSFAELVHRHPTRMFQLRSGTALWHGDKSFLHLQADVLDVRHVNAGDVAGYRSNALDAPTTIVMAGAGSAHGVRELPGALSPFHHAGRRVAMFESPHMHTTMLRIPAGEATPAVGDWLDVQRPLITVAPDEVVWR